MRLLHPLGIGLICRSQYGEYTFQKTMESNVRWESLQHWIELSNRQLHSQYLIFMKKYLVNTVMDSDRGKAVMMQSDRHSAI